MLAWRLHAPAPIASRPLRLEEVAAPSPGAGEVVVRVHLCALCRTDLHVVEGELPPRGRPVVPGHQVVGTIAACGAEVPSGRVGERVGVAWVNATCGACRFCTTDRENLCERAAFTGWTVDGGFAEQVLAPAAFVHPLPAGFDDAAAAPLLCAGIIGHRALGLTGLAGWAGARVGLYGFGAAGHVALQIARGRGAEVFVFTRDRSKHQPLALELGASFVGDVEEAPPRPLDAAIIFAPAGPLVPVALAAVERGATVVLGGIHMSELPAMPYQRLYGERVLRTVTNNTRADAAAFLAEAARLPVKIHTERFAFAEANEALGALAHGALRGAGVLEVAGEGLSGPAPRP